VGRQVSCTVKVGALCTLADVLLELGELMLRGPLRLKLPFPSLWGVAARGETLEVHAPEGPLAIEVGPDAPIPEAASRAAAKAAGLVDVKVVALSAMHSAEELVIPVSQRR
jgi:hypothetical protein